jgi:hypothetical protein
MGAWNSQNLSGLGREARCLRRCRKRGIMRCSAFNQRQDQRAISAARLMAAQRVRASLQM